MELKLDDGELKTFTSRTVLFKEGDKATKLFKVHSGEILILKELNSRLTPVYLAKEGDIIGEVSCFADTFHTYSAVTKNSVRLEEISALKIKHHLKESPDWMRDLLASMVNRLAETIHLLSENRIQHESIISAGEFTPEFEVQLKKLLA